MPLRSLCFEDWKEKNPNADKNKYEYYWRKLSQEKKQVFRTLSLHPTLSELRMISISHTGTVQRSLYVIDAFVNNVYFISCFYRIQNRSQAIAAVSLYCRGGRACGPPGGAQGGAEGRGGRTIDMVRYALARFDRRRLHSFSLDSGIGINSIQIYSNPLAYTRALKIVTLRNR